MSTSDVPMTDTATDDVATDPATGGGAATDVVAADAPATGRTPHDEPSDGAPSTTAQPCCPELPGEDRCDVLAFDYRLEHVATVQTEDGVRRVPVEVVLRARLERCSGPLQLGDLVYSTTLLPGETVRLFSLDRRSRFTYDAATDVAYRHEQTSEESHYVKSMATAWSSFSSREDLAVDQSSQDAFTGSGKTSGVLGTLFNGPSASVRGEHTASSTLDFARELSGYTEASHEASVSSVRESSAAQVGEVQTRTHVEGESEASVESSSRTLHNANRCRAVSYLFHQVSRRSTVRFSIEAVRRRVVDPRADTAVRFTQPPERGEVHAIPQGVLATDAQRVETVTRARRAAAADRLPLVAGDGLQLAGFGGRSPVAFAALQVTAPPLTDEQRSAALAQVDAQLVATGVLTDEQQPGEALARLSFERTTSLPTPGIVVRACLDECDACEPQRHREIELDLERRELENRLLARQVELLDQSQEYRCCPAGSTEHDHAPVDA